MGVSAAALDVPALLDRAAREEGFRRLFAPVEGMPGIDPAKPALQSAAVVYSNVYIEAMKRCGSAPGARAEAQRATAYFLETLFSFLPPEAGK